MLLSTTYIHNLQRHLDYIILKIQSNATPKYTNPVGFSTIH